MSMYARRFPGLLMMVLLCSSCGGRQKESPPTRITPVELAPVSREQIALPVRTVGLAAFAQQSRLAFKTGGYVTILAREGQAVAGGQALAQLNPAEIEAQVAQARSAFDKAQRDEQRVKRLYEEGAATREQFQNVETALQVAESALQIARFNLEHSTITASGDGVILKQFAENGELVGPGTPIFYFGSGSKASVVHAFVSARDLSQLKLGDVAEAQFDAYPGITFSGTISKIARAADAQTGMFEVEIKLQSIDRLLAVGMVASVTILPTERQTCTLIPIEAVVEADGDQGSVFALIDDAARKRPVTLGAMFGDRIIVTAGLENVEQVITVGAALLHDGDRVRPN